MRKKITSKYFRRKKAQMSRKLREVSKDLQKLSRHIRDL